MREYINTLLNPKKTKGSKIPTRNFTPTCSFQLHYQYNVPVDGKGFCGLCFNPFFLSDDSIKDYKGNINFPEGENIKGYEIRRMSTFFVKCERIGHSEWTYAYIGQTIPALYSSYRLVSAEINFKYIGDISRATGYICGAVINDDDKIVGSNITLKYPQYNINTSTEDFILDKYNENTIKNSYYYIENKIIDGFRMIYYPLDNSYEEFVKVYKGPGLRVDKWINSNRYSISLSDEYFKSGFKWIIFLNGIDRYSIGSVLMEIHCNYECIPDLKYINYLPMSIIVSCYIPKNIKEKIIEYLKNNK